jgi:hypothetical protein
LHTKKTGNRLSTQQLEEKKLVLGLYFVYSLKQTLLISMADIKAIQEEWRAEFLSRSPKSDDTPYMGAIAPMELMRDHSSAGAIHGSFEEWFVRWFGSDPDDVCAYSTPKVTRIRSWQLGITSNGIKIFIIFFYIIGYTIIINKGYLRFSSIDKGIVQSSIFSRPPSHKPDYCCECSARNGQPTDNATCPIAGFNTPANKNVLGQTGKSCCYYGYPKDSQSVRFATNGAGFLSFVTRYNHLTTKTICPATNLTDAELGFAVDPSCSAIADKSAIPYFIAGVEDFTIGLNHGISPASGGSVVSTKRMKGKLVRRDGDNVKVIKEWMFDDANDYDKAGTRKSNYDIITVAELMEASGEWNINRHNRLVRPGEWAPSAEVGVLQ